MARLFVLPIATHLAAEVAGAGPLHPVLGNQLVRSTSSVALNIAAVAASRPPGAGRFGRDRLQHYRIAYGSCQEAKTTVEILVLSGHLDRETGRRWWSSLHRIGGLIWGLMKSLQ
jgi:four helix bundle protein